LMWMCRVCYKSCVALRQRRREVWVRDCPRCTYQNRPERQHCEMCHARLRLPPRLVVPGAPGAALAAAAIARGAAVGVEAEAEAEAAAAAGEQHPRSEEHNYSFYEAPAALRQQQQPDDERQERSPSQQPQLSSSLLVTSTTAGGDGSSSASTSLTHMTGFESRQQQRGVVDATTTRTDIDASQNLLPPSLGLTTSSKPNSASVSRNSSLFVPLSTQPSLLTTTLNEEKFEHDHKQPDNERDKSSGTRGSAVLATIPATGEAADDLVNAV